MKTCCTVVIGHVDHGKTALVRALTGIDTDRLEEEKRRGLSITPGFAHCTFQTGVADLIDAPGHADFIRAMVRAASGAEAALLVVSAVDGVCVQTREHLRIIGLLGIARGVVALTKSDLVTTKDIAARQSEVRQVLSKTPLKDAPLLPCSAVSGAGLDLLKDALCDMLADAPPAAVPPGAVLPIDRAFSVAGQGTVVTGTLQGGALHVGSTAMIQPGQIPVRLRGLQARGAACDTGWPGTRVAVNVRGVSVADVPPGSLLSTTEHVAASTVFDVGLSLLPEAPPLKHMSKLRVLFGTQNAVATVRLIGRAGRALSAGQQCFAQLRFDAPVAGFAGQRAILRQLSPAQTLGGAVVLDPQAHQMRSKDLFREPILAAVQRQESPAIARALSAASGGVAEIRDVARLARTRQDMLWAQLGDDFLRLSPDMITAKSDVAQTDNMLRAALVTYHADHPLRPMAPLQDLPLAQVHAALLSHLLLAGQQAGSLRRTGDKIALAGHDPMAHLTADQASRMAEIEEMYRTRGVTPPMPKDAAKTPEEADLLNLLVHNEALVSLHNTALNQTVVFHRDALRRAAQDLRGIFPAPQWFKTGAARAALGTSRKFIVPMLEHFDEAGLTRRADDLRQMVAPPV